MLPPPADAEQVRQLVDDDHDADPGQEAGDDRGRQQLGYPPEPKCPDERHDHAGHHREDPDELAVTRDPEAAIAHTGREQRRDRRSAPTDNPRLVPTSANSSYRRGMHRSR